MGNLIDKLKNLPNSAGIYQYYDKNAKLLYIGKAKNLKNRIKSYFALTPTLESSLPIPNPKASQRIQIMVRQISSLETIIVESEQDALILENSLIKQLKPKYNILLRDDKTYPYIAFNLDEDFPTPKIVRAISKDKNMRYFGPYPSGCRDILESLLELFMLVQRASCTCGKKACLFHQINRCYAPCEGKISKLEYKKILDSALDALKSPSKLISLLEAKMFSLSESMRFEEALIYRERIKKLKSIKSFSSIDLAKGANLDVFGLHCEGKKAVLLSLFVRQGKIVSFLSNILHCDSGEFELSEIFTQAILNRYAQNLPIVPKEILLPDISGLDVELLSDFLHQKQGIKVKIIAPQIGEKKRLITLANNNAKEILAQESIHIKNEENTLIALKSLLKLEQIPFRIEVFDTSHHASENCVGGMVVYENGEFIKDSYRRYKLLGRDEYAQMREMLTRRAKDFENLAPPNLWLLDGGKAQIKIAKEILESSGANIDIIGIAKQKIDSKAYRAKGNAKDTIYTLESSINLESSDARLQLLQKLRDEAHRYAITYHRAKKKKSMTEFSALEKQGFSAAQIKKLLALTGSYAAIKDLSTQELKEILKNAKRV